jgi:hypothetical protein
VKKCRGRSLPDLDTRGFSLRTLRFTAEASRVRSFFASVETGVLEGSNRDFTHLRRLKSLFDRRIRGVCGWR